MTLQWFRGEADLWKNLPSKLSCQCAFNSCSVENSQNRKTGNTISKSGFLVKKLHTRTLLFHNFIVIPSKQHTICRRHQINGTSQQNELMNFFCIYFQNRTLSDPFAKSEFLALASQIGDMFKFKDTNFVLYTYHLTVFLRVRLHGRIWLPTENDFHHLWRKCRLPS